MPGRTHDLTAGRTHRVIATCDQLGVRILAGKGYLGAGDIAETPIKAKPGRELPAKHTAYNPVHARLRTPVERAVARLKTRRIFRRARCSPSWLTSAVAAILTLTIHT